MYLQQKNEEKNCDYQVNNFQSICIDICLPTDPTHNIAHIISHHGKKVQRKQ